VKITVIGEGAWGSAISTLLTNNGHDVLLWCYHENIANEINSIHQNRRYMSGLKLSEKIKATSSIKDAIEYSDYIFEAIPVEYLRSVLNSAKEFVKQDQKWISLSKGIEADTLLLPTQIFEDVFENRTINSAVLGPSFAQELVRKELTAVNVSSKDLDTAKKISEILNSDYFRACISEDLIGIEIAAALKNVITLGIGILEGANKGDNTRAMLVTIGMHEIAKLATKMGAKSETIYGLSGLGDLILTATGKYSKNLEVGRRLGSGQKLEKIIQDTGYIPESINSVKAIFKLSKKYDLSLPLCQNIFNIVNGSRTIQDILPLLFNCLV